MTHASSVHGRVLLPGSFARIQKKRGDGGNALKVIDDRGQLACEKQNFSVSYLHNFSQDYSSILVCYLPRISGLYLVFIQCTCLFR